MARVSQTCNPLLAAGILGLAGCGGSGGAGVTAAPAPTPAALYGIALGNLQIAAALYQDSNRTPAGFYADPAPPGEAYVSTYHVRSSDVAAGVTTDYELCTDDWNQALSWSEAAAGTGTGYANLVNNSSTSHYFEFDRIGAGTPQVYVRQRVYLCSYLDRSDTVAGVSPGPAGTLNQRPISAAELGQLSEYLWRFTSWNNYGNAVLASEPDPVATGMTHSLVVAALVANGAAPGCDRIEVSAWQHAVDTTSGALTRTLTPLWSFNAQQSGNAAVSCGT